MLSRLIFELVCRSKAAAPFLIIAAGFQLMTPLPADAADWIGRVKTLEGIVYVERDGSRDILSAGDRVMLGDWLETDGSGSVGIAFRDNTIISIGPRTRLLLREYAFAPADDQLGFALDLVRGTLLYISGIIAKLLPDAVEVRTPASTVAVRGTRFLAAVEPES